MSIITKFFRSRLFYSILIGLSVTSVVYYTVSSIYGEQYYANWEEIEVTSIEDVSGETIFPFEGDIGHQYYLGSLNKNRAAYLAEMSALYNREIAHLWRLFDKQRSYEEDHFVVTNLHVLNQMTWPTNWVQVDDQLFTALHSAYQAELTSNHHFSIFGGKLADYWDERFYGLNPELIDPSISSEAAEELSAITTKLAEVSSNVDAIQFDVDAKMVRINVEENALLELDFQFFEDALAIEALNEYFANDDIDDSGFFYSVDGYIETRGLNPNGYLNYWSFEVIAPKIEMSDVIATFSFAHDGPIHQITLTDIRHPLSYYYSPIDDINNLNEVRHPYYSAVTGYPSREIRQITVIGTSSLVSDLAATLRWAQWNAEFIRSTLINTQRTDIIVAIIDTPLHSLSSLDYDLTVYQGFNTSVEFDPEITINP